MAVGVGTDTHYVNVGAAVQEGTQEASGVSERAQGVGVATDAEHSPDTKDVHPLDDSVHVSLVLHHAGRDVGDHRETPFGVAGAQIQGVVDRFSRRAGHRDGGACRQVL